MNNTRKCKQRSGRKRKSVTIKEISMQITDNTFTFTIVTFTARKYAEASYKPVLLEK